MFQPEMEQESCDSSAPSTVLEFTHSGEKIRLDLFLCQQLPGRSRAFVQRLIEDGWVDIPSKTIKASMSIHPGTSVRVTLPPNRKSAIEPQEIPIEIFYEDENLAVINKPAGLVMHPSDHQTQNTLVNSLLYHLQDLSGIGGEERPGIVHRLDRFTSGVLIVAKDDRTHQLLSTQFKDRLIKKTYIAIVRGQLTARAGTINLPIGRSYLDRKRMMVRTDGQSRDAITHYQVDQEFDGFASLRVNPVTGRTHQIRVHLAKLRTPVLCDHLYGREQKLYLSDLQGKPDLKSGAPILERQALHAAQIEFSHPITGERLSYEAPLPQDMQLVLELLSQNRSM